MEISLHVTCTDYCAGASIYRDLNIDDRGLIQYTFIFLIYIYIYIFISDIYIYIYIYISVYTAVRYLYQYVNEPFCMIQ